MRDPMYGISVPCFSRRWVNCPTCFPAEDKSAEKQLVFAFLLGSLCGLYHHAAPPRQDCSGASTIEGDPKAISFLPLT